MVALSKRSKDIDSGTANVGRVCSWGGFSIGGVSGVCGVDLFTKINVIAKQITMLEKIAITPAKI